MIEYLPEQDKYHVYALLCQDLDGNGYIKIGRSRRVWFRVDELLTACPIPAKYVAIAKMPCRTTTNKVESQLHKAFKHRKSQGEWYHFDFSSDEDKREFNDKSAAIFRTLRNSPQWEKTDLAPILRARKEKKELMRKTGYMGKLIRQGNQRIKNNYAKRELANYGKT